MSTIQLNAWVVNNLISSFYQLCNDVISLTSLKITLPLYLLLSVLRSRIPCKHNAWAADNLAPLNVLFLSIDIISLVSPKITLELFLLLAFVKWNVIFTLRKMVQPKPEQPDHFRRPCTQNSFSIIFGQ